MPGRKLTANISSSGTRKKPPPQDGRQTAPRTSRDASARQMPSTQLAWTGAHRAPGRANHWRGLDLVHIAVQSSRCFAVRFGVKFVR